MKVSLNLAISPTPRERYALAWALPVLLLASVSLVFLSRSTARSAAEYRKFRHDRVVLQNQEDALIKQESELTKKFENPESRQVTRAAQYLNALIEKKRVTLTEVTEKVTKLLPVSVRLVSLSLSQQGGDWVAHFLAMSKSEAALESFLINLENSPDFKDVANFSQSPEAAGAGGALPSMTCTARYVGAERR